MPKKNKWDIKDFKTLRAYNALDAWRTLQLDTVLDKKLKEAGKTDVYTHIYQTLLEPLLDMSVRGVKVDTQTLKRDFIKYSVECQILRQQVEEAAGKPLHTDKSFSVKKVTEYLYNEIGFKKLHSSPTNEVALRQIQYIYEKKIKEYDETDELPFQPLTIFKDLKKKRYTKEDMKRFRQGLKVVKLILEYREKFQISTFLQPGRIDEDGRFRCKYKFTTGFCRLSSSKNAFGTGANTQNFPSAAKHILIPNDDTHLLLELDLSQSENRIIGCLTGDNQLIKLAKSRPNEFDVHRYNASIIFKIPAEQITKAQRHLAKRVVYATAYGMGSARLQEILMNDGYFHTVLECQSMIDAYLGGFPAIQKWQERTYTEAIQKKELVNSWGQRFSFYHDVVLNGVDKHLKNRLLACRPQSDSGILLNVQGLVPSWNYIKDEMPDKAQLLLQVHDSLVFSVWKKLMYDLACRVRDMLETPHNFYGTELSIPAQIKWGTNYRDLHEIEDVKELQNV